MPYFSAAGNLGTQSYESRFVDSGIFDTNGCEYHNFGGPNILDWNQTINVTEFSFFVLQWDDAFFSVSGPPGAQTDLEIALHDTAGKLLYSDPFDDTGADPWSFAFTSTPMTVQLTISHCSGPRPAFMKWLGIGSVEILEHDTKSSTVFGHANVPYVAGVGAAFFQETPVYGQDPPFPQLTSSAGGTPILFDRNGTRLQSCGMNTYERRLQPQFVAPDGISNSFFGNFLDFEPSGEGFYFFGMSIDLSRPVSSVSVRNIPPCPSASPLTWMLFQPQGHPQQHPMLLLLLVCCCKLILH